MLSLIEPVLHHDVGLQFDGIALMDLPAEELVTLPSGDEARFREVVGADGCCHWGPLRLRCVT